MVLWAQISYDGSSVLSFSILYQCNTFHQSSWNFIRQLSDWESSIWSQPRFYNLPRAWNYNFSREPWIFSMEPWEFSGVIRGSPNEFQGANTNLAQIINFYLRKVFFLFFVVNLSVLSHFSLYFLLKHFTSSGNSNCQTAQVLFIQSNNQFLFKKCFFFFYFVVNISILSHFSLYFLLKHFTSSSNSNNKPQIHSSSPGSIHTIQ